MTYDLIVDTIAIYQLIPANLRRKDSPEVLVDNTLLPVVDHIEVDHIAAVADHIVEVVHIAVVRIEVVRIAVVVVEGIHLLLPYSLVAFRLPLAI